MGLAVWWIANPWALLAFWIVVYVSDYSMTIICARLYRARASGVLVYEGSFELNPVFQRDVDALKAISLRFVSFLVLSTGAVLFVWWQASIDASAYELSSFELGALFLSELSIHIRHFRNLNLFQSGFGQGGLRGKVEYPRPLMLRLSASEHFAFAGLFATLFLLTSNWFLCGGAVGCLALALKMWRLARKSAGIRQASGEAKPGSS